MDITFRTAKLRKACNDASVRKKTFGPRTSEILGRRLDDLRAADDLDQIRRLPGLRCHELKGARAGQLAVDLDHPRRVVFEPEEPRPLRDDGSLDWAQVTSIVVIEVVDYH
jgi:plasmid maintenance system killer protein